MTETIIDILEAHRDVTQALDELLNKQIEMLRVNQEQQRLIETLSKK